MEQSINIDLNNIEPTDDNCVFRCINCFQIPLITLFEENNEPKIKYICECTLSEKDKYKIISIKEFLENFNQLSLNSMMCEDCDKENFNEMNLCLTCKKPFCDECIQKHKNNNPGHEIINIDKLDNYCHIHKDETIVAWCIECKVNLCSFCFGIHENCEYRIIDDIKLNDNQIETYKNSLKGIISFFYNGIKGINNNMISKCNDNNEKKEINNLYEKYYEINDNMIKLSEKSMCTFLLYKDKYIYPIIQNMKNLCNLNKNIIFKNNITIEEYKNYLKKNFIIQYSEIEEPEQKNNSSLPELNEETMKMVMEMIKNINLNTNKDGILTNYISISYVDNPTESNISNLKCVKTVKSSFQYYTNLLNLNNNRFAISLDVNIQIYDINNFQLLNELTGHSYEIFSLALFKDNNIFASGDIKGNIKIWKFENNNYKCIGNITSEIQNVRILKLKYLSTGNLASLTHKSIEIWKSESPYTIEKKIISNRDNEYISLLETKNNILVTGSTKGNLIFYNPVDLSIIKTLSITCLVIKGMIELKNNKIAIKGNEGIYIVDIIKIQLEKIIVNENKIISLFCLNDNTILTAETDNALRQYDYRTCTLIGSIEGSSQATSLDLLQINDKYIINAAMFSFNIWEFKK